MRRQTWVVTKIIVVEVESIRTLTIVVVNSLQINQAYMNTFVSNLIMIYTINYEQRLSLKMLYCANNSNKNAQISKQRTPQVNYSSHTSAQ